MKILLTGPGSAGKTTILNELEKLGYKMVREHAREIWAEGHRDDEFELAVLEKRIEVFQYIEDIEKKGKKEGDNKIIFFDRSFLDSVNFRKFDKKPVLQQFVDAANKYRFDKVFVLEPLDKYKHDGMRELFVKNKEEAEKWYYLMLETCKQFRYKPIIVKNMPLQERVEFILERLSEP